MTRADEWSHWLQYSRFGQTWQRDESLMSIFRARDRLLDLAPLRDISSLLDFGCGDGLVGLQAALETKPETAIYFVDQSEAALELCKANVKCMNIEHRCKFVQTNNSCEYPFGDISVDCVLSRAAIMYAEDKVKLMHSFYRVLNERGYLCFCEPINRFRISGRAKIFTEYSLPQWKTEIKKICQRIFSAQRNSAELMLQIDPESMARWLEDAGFKDIVCLAEYRSLVGRPLWDELVYAQANPYTPSIFEVAQAIMDPDKWARFEAELRAEWNTKTVRKRAGLLFCRARKDAVIPSLA